MISRNILLITSITLLGSGVGLFWYFSTDKTEWNFGDLNQINEQGEEDTLTSNETQVVLEGMKRYLHPTYNFSLLVPEEMTIQNYKEKGGAQTVTFETPDANPPRDFQIYIVPYNEEQITSSQIAKDTHGTAIGEPQEVILGGNVRGIIFESENQTLGRLREVWFLMKGRLFEVTTTAGNDEWLAEILSTLNPNTP